MPTQIHHCGYLYFVVTFSVLNLRHYRKPQSLKVNNNIPDSILWVDLGKLGPFMYKVQLKLHHPFVP